MESIQRTRKRFWKSFSTFDSIRDYPQRISSDNVHRNRETVPEARRMKTSHTCEDRQNQGTIPMPTLAPRPLTTSSIIQVELPQNFMVLQQRQQVSELQFDKFPNPQSLLVWKNSIQDTGHHLFWFSIGCYVVDHRSGDGWFFLDELKLPAVTLWKGFSKLRDAGREDCLCSEQDHPEFPVQEEAQLRGAESPIRGPVSTRKADRLQDLRKLSGDWRSWHSIGLCWFILCYSSWWQHSGIRYKMGRSSIVEFKKFHQRWSLGMYVQIEDTWVWKTQNRIRIVRHGDIHQKKSVPNYQKLKTMVKRWKDQTLRLRNFWRQTWENSITSSDKESKGIVRRWRRKRYLLSVERNRPVFPRRPLQFPPRYPRSCAKTRTHCRHTFWANRFTRSKCVEEEKYPRQK